MMELLGWGLAVADARAITTQAMRAVLARRLDALMRSTPGCETQLALSKRSGVGQSTIGRILRAEVPALLDHLVLLAGALGVNPCDLLREATEPQQPVSGQNLIDSLPAEGKARIAAFVEFTLNEYAAKHPGLLTFAEHKEAPAGAVASIGRAAMRPVVSGDEKKNHDESLPAPRRRGRPRKVAGKL